MAYSFKPKSEEEVLADELCAEGLQPFTIMESSEIVSKSEKNAGKPLIKLKLNIHGDDGFDYHVYDYIADWFMAHKFRHFFCAVGLEAEYNRGNIDAANNRLAGRAGWATVGIQKAQGQYGPKNIIKDYNPQAAKAVVKPEAKPKAAAAAPETNDDDVPF